MAMFLAKSSLLNLFKDKEVQQAFVVFLNSPLAIAVATQVITITQWNLEHTAVTKDYKGDLTLRRLSTEETSNLRDKNTTPIAPPLLSNAIRLADGAADVAASAAALASKSLETTKNEGALAGLWKTIFGGEPGKPIF